MFYRVTRKSGTEEISQDEEITDQQDLQYQNESKTIRSRLPV